MVGARAGTIPSPHPMSSRPVRPLAVAVAVLLTAPPLPPLRAQAEERKEAPPPAGELVPAKKPDVIFVPTPQEAVDKMLELAQIKPGDVLYDLGCGDGRIVVTAAKKFGIRAVGVDIDPERVKESRARVRAAGVEHLVTIKQADIFALDFSDASVVTLYLLPSLNVRLKPKLAALPRGTRIVSYDFDMAGATPKQVVEIDTDERQVSIYLWEVPWEGS